MAELNMKNICQQKSVWCDWLFDFLGLKKLKFFNKSIFSSSVGAASCDGNFLVPPNRDGSVSPILGKRERSTSVIAGMLLLLLLLLLLLWLLFGHNG